MHDRLKECVAVVEGRSELTVFYVPRRTDNVGFTVIAQSSSNAWCDTTVDVYNPWRSPYCAGDAPDSLRTSYHVGGVLHICDELSKRL